MHSGLSSLYHREPNVFGLALLYQKQQNRKGREPEGKSVCRHIRNTDSFQEQVGICAIKYTFYLCHSNSSQEMFFEP